MRTLTIDLETTTKTSARRTANPFDKDNEIVCIAYKYTDATEAHVEPWDIDKFYEIVRNVDTLIGQNIKFDILYLLNATKDTKWLKNIKLYDTMFAEYLLSGQQSKFISLDKLSVKYGGTLKDNKISEYWKNGVSTWDIPQDMLYEYAEHDILNTELVYLAQRKLTKTQQQRMIDVNMDDLLATTLIEYNGMQIDINFANAKIEELGEFDYEKLNIYLPKDLPFTFNWNSNDHLSAILFGGDIKYTEKELIGQYKTGTRSGEDKYKIIDKLYNFPAKVRGQRGIPTKKPGTFKVDDSVLCEFASQKGLAASIATILLAERDRNKQVSTYYKPMVDLSQIDGLLHAELIHVQTNTGRLSSRNPNIQNWSKGSSSDIKACCASRWGAEGSIVEIDAAQLEIVVQAYLAQEDRMIEEIKKGTDFHCLRLANKLNKPYDEIYTLCKIDKDPAWDYQRTMTKAFSFQRAYGAGAKAISASTGLSEHDVKELIAAEDALFPNVKLFNDSNIAEVTRNKKLIKVEDQLLASGHMESITGRKYVFYEEDAPDFLRKKGIMKTFSPTQIKNYTVQGFGAEILAVFRADIARKLIGREDRIVMINTVHDSIIFDCKDSILNTFIEWLDKESKLAIKLVEKRYSININVPLGWDIKSGKNWKHMK